MGYCGAHDLILDDDDSCPICRSNNKKTKGATDNE